ncbi:unnamed protein product, partial [marine sediment metagenome]
YAKKNGYIDEEDPIPTRAMHHIARQRLGFTPRTGKRLPRGIYLDVLDIVEAEF